MKLLDISNNNAPLPAGFFTAAKGAGIDGVYAKASEGLGFDDACDDAWVPQARAAGLLVGSYHFGHVGDGSAKAEAQHFLKVAQALKPGDLVPMLDCEAGSGVEALSWIGTWLDVVEDALGCAPGIYTGDWWWRPHVVGVGDMSRYPLWQSGYSSSAPRPTAGWTSIDLWQFTDSLAVDGKHFDASSGTVPRIAAPAVAPPPALPTHVTPPAGTNAWWRGHGYVDTHKLDKNARGVYTLTNQRMAYWDVPGRGWMDVHKIPVDAEHVIGFVPTSTGWKAGQ